MKGHVHRNDDAFAADQDHLRCRGPRASEPGVDRRRDGRRRWGPRFGLAHRGSGMVRRARAAARSRATVRDTSCRSDRDCPAGRLYHGVHSVRRAPGTPRSRLGRIRDHPRRRELRRGSARRQRPGLGLLTYAEVRPGHPDPQCQRPVGRPRVLRRSRAQRGHRCQESRQRCWRRSASWPALTSPGLTPVAAACRARLASRSLIGASRPAWCAIITISPFR